MDVDDDRDLERMLALYRDACAAAGIEPLGRQQKRASWRCSFVLGALVIISFVLNIVVRSATPPH